MAECVKLRKLRKFHEQTCEDMAKLINVSTRAYHNKEKGISQFKLNEMVAISQFFGETMENIFLNEKFK